MRKKHFGDESVFAFVWDAADADGMWEGDDSAIAAEFGVTEGEACDMISQLTDRNLMQRIGDAKYIITRWREHDEPAEE